MQISGHKTRRYNIVSDGNTPFFSACEQRGAEEFRATRIREPKKRFYVVEERRGGANP